MTFSGLRQREVRNKGGAFTVTDWGALPQTLYAYSLDPFTVEDSFREKVLFVKQKSSFIQQVLLRGRNEGYALCMCLVCGAFSEWSLMTLLARQAAFGL